MTFKTADRVYETSTTTGTGTYTLLGAPTGFQAFSVLGANNDCPYFATDDTNWEVGIGTVLTGPARLQRTTVYASSNAGSAVNWGAGTRKIRCGEPADLALFRALSKSVAGGVDVALTTDEQRRNIITLTGALTANINVTVDTTVWDWIVINNTTGGFQITFKTTAGTGIIVGQGQTLQLACDGTNVVMAEAATPTTGGIGKNVVINGDMEIAQRGTSFAAIANAAYSLDRWMWLLVGAAVHTITQDTDVPTVAQAGRLFTHSLKMALTTADTSIAAGDIVALRQRIEGYNWRALAQRVVTMSFWIKSPITGIHGAYILNTGGDRSCVKEFTILQANTWEKKILTFPASPSAGTWDYATGVGAEVGIVLAAGSNFQGTADAYQSSGIRTTANQVNGVNTGITPYFITGMQLEAGSVATEFENISYKQQLALCRRYCRVSTYNGSSSGIGPSQNNTTANAQVHIAEDVQMRTIPTLTADGVAADYSVYVIGGVAACASVPNLASTASADIIVLNFPTNPASLTLGNAGTGLIVGANGKLTLSAEL